MAISPESKGGYMWNLYLVCHPAGTFILVAKSIESAIEHAGTQASITLITDETTILEMRLTMPEKVLLAIN